jgi:uncharacterized protein (TIGR02246 family)
MLRASGIAVLWLIFALSACQPPASEGPAEMTESAPAGLSSDDLAANQATTNAWLDGARAGDMAALAATYTTDGVLMPPNHEAVEGRAGIQAFMESFPHFTEIDLQPIEVNGEGDLAYVRGTYTVTMAPEGGQPINDTGKYMEIRQKQADGSWLIARDEWNSDLPLPGSETMQNEQ